MNKREIYIHIGYPKTASTTLQNHLFLNLYGFELIGQPLTIENKRMQKLIHTITDCEKLEYIEQEVKKELSVLLATNKTKLLISEESFSTGSSLSGRVDRSQIAIRLKSLFPNAKIIVVLREQKSIIKSYYKQKRKMFPDFELSFDHWFECNKKNMHIENVFQYFYYEKIIELYENFFGKNNIKILLFEEFKTEKKIFFYKLLDFCDVPELYINTILKELLDKHDNQTVTENFLKIQKFKNQYSFFKNILPIFIKKLIVKKAKSGKKLCVNMNNEQIQYVNNLYKLSNTNLSERYNLQLNKYGYSMEYGNV